MTINNAVSIVFTTRKNFYVEIFAPFPLDSGLFIGLINQICTHGNELSLSGSSFLDVVLLSIADEKMMRVE